MRDAGGARVAQASVEFCSVMQETARGRRRSVTEFTYNRDKIAVSFPFRPTHRRVEMRE